MSRAHCLPLAQKVGSLLIATLMFTGCTTSHTNNGAGKLSSLTYPPIDTSIPRPIETALSNGITVLMMPDAELPLISVTAKIKAGSIWEPFNKTGLASLTGAAMRSGGAGKFKPDALDEALENIAASVEVGAEEESTDVMMSALSKDTDQALGLFADVILRPRFDKERIELVRARMLDGIRRKNDDPTQVGTAELNTLLYAGSPYGADATVKTVNAITVADIKEFHNTFFTPAKTIIGVTGDFDPKTMVATLEGLFGKWNTPEPGYPAVAPATSSAGGIYIADKKTPQSVIRAARLTIVDRNHPDYYACRVMNEILGGNGFSSRLTQKIRVEKGLAYAVWSYHIAGRWEQGKFIFGTETKTSSTAETLAILRHEINSIGDGVTAEEMTIAKNSIINSFVFIFDTPSRIMSQWMVDRYYGMPDDYLDRYRERVDAVTADDVTRVAQAYLAGDELILLVVGDAATLSDSVKPLGPITTINLTPTSGDHSGHPTR